MAGRPVRLLRGLDDEAGDGVVRPTSRDDDAFAAALSELRLIKDELGDRRTAGRDRRDQTRLRRRRARVADRRHRARGRGRVQPARAGRGQRRRLLDDRRLRARRVHPALGAQRPAASRAANCCCSTPASKRSRSTPPTSRARCRSAARSRRRSARSTRSSGKRSARRSRPASPATTFSIPTAPRCACSPHGLERLGILPSARRGAARRQAVLQALLAAQRQPHARSRRARLRQGPRRDVQVRQARAGHGPHGRAGTLLPARRPDRPGALPRHRRAHRGRRGDHRPAATRTSQRRFRASPTRSRPGSVRCAGTAPEPWVVPPAE